MTLSKILWAALLIMAIVGGILLFTDYMVIGQTLTLIGMIGSTILLFRKGLSKKTNE
jgi:hypothetical protein